MPYRLSDQALMAAIGAGDQGFDWNPQTNAQGGALRGQARAYTPVADASLQDIYNRADARQAAIDAAYAAKPNYTDAEYLAKFGNRTTGISQIGTQPNGTPIYGNDYTPEYKATMNAMRAGQDLSKLGGGNAPRAAIGSEAYGVYQTPFKSAADEAYARQTEQAKIYAPIQQEEVKGKYNVIQEQMKASAPSKIGKPFQMGDRMVYLNADGAPVDIGPAPIKANPNALPPDKLDSMLEQVYAGKIGPSQFLTSIRNPGAKAELFARMEELHPGYDWTAGDAEYKWKVNPQRIRSVQRIQALAPKLNSLSEQFDKATAGIPFANDVGAADTVGLAVKDFFGSKAARAFETNKASTIMEARQALTDIGAMTDKTVEMEFNNFKNASTPEQMKTAKDNLLEILANKYKTFQGKLFSNPEGDTAPLSFEQAPITNTGSIPSGIPAGSVRKTLKGQPVWVSPDGTVYGG